MGTAGKAVSVLGALLFQIFFGVALAGGVIGLILTVAHWRDYQQEEVNILPAVGLLCAVLAVIGLMGIMRFRDPRVAGLDAEINLAPLRRQKPLGNILGGALLTAAAIGGTLLSYHWSDSNGTGFRVYTVPVVGLAAGVLQLGFGLWQLAPRRRK